MGAVKPPVSRASTGTDAPQVGADEKTLFPTARKTSHRNSNTPESRPTPHVTAPETLETAPLLGWQGVSLCAQTVHNSQNSRYIHQ
ncbi:hypothetical protein L7O55_19845 [Escherichia coli]|uniref:hypothetical protein n=1 Tax=Escherichia coli TaxID=562 RepID=UPI0019ECDB0C|nr:hypothetical protein [Escherichia coli]EGO3755104.1 hypothetical protein [Escherichia coli]EGO4001438.1 hypothetical protein [Escherichia coli]EGO4035793.1 hypothetical protein [Escherichia coli]